MLTLPLTQAPFEAQSISLQVHASDADMDALTYSAAALPLGLTINTTSGLIGGTIAYSVASLSMQRNVTTTLSVGDGSHLVSGTMIWNVSDVNRLPSVSGQSGTEGQSVSLTV